VRSSVGKPSIEGDETVRPARYRSAAEAIAAGYRPLRRSKIAMRARFPHGTSRRLSYRAANTSIGIAACYNPGSVCACRDFCLT
jgi:hypothetical protein